METDERILVRGTRTVEVEVSTIFILFIFFSLRMPTDFQTSETGVQCRCDLMRFFKIFVRCTVYEIY